MSAPASSDIGRLVVRCPDRPGIVAVLSGLMAELGANITDSQQHSSDPTGGTFTLRLEFLLAGLAQRRPELERRLAALGADWQMTWRLTDAAHRPTLAVFVSKTDHVLQELIYRVRAGDLCAEIAMVVSNHLDLEPVARGAGIPFHHIPVTPSTKADAEARALVPGMIAATESDWSEEYLDAILAVRLVDGLDAAIDHIARYGSAHWMVESPDLSNYPYTPPPGWGYPLPVVYLVWAVVVAAMYPLCRWFAPIKQRRTNAWLSYL